MKKAIVSFVMFFGVACGLSAQNVTVVSAAGQNVETFVKNFFVGEGVHVFNVKFNNVSGNIVKPQIGTFQSNGFVGAMMDSGIVLTTGDVSVAEGPNSNGAASQPVGSYYSDPLMGVVSTGNIMACATLDFDFVCLSNHVSFNYCFGSEEYPEYVGSNFNDVFVFFLTGPDPETGLSTTRNIALVPNSVTDSTPDGIAVAINSINSGIPGSSGSSGINIHPEYSSYYCENPIGTNGIEYNGYTVKLNAEAGLVPCEVYHMHISICNIDDNNRDSGVIIEGKSLNSTTVDLEFEENGGATIRRSIDHDVVLTLAGTGYNSGVTHLSFGGELANGDDFICLDDHGYIINDSSDSMIINGDPHFFTIRGTSAADLSTPKEIIVYLATELCPMYPELLVYDTLHFVMVEDDTTTHEPEGIDDFSIPNTQLSFFPNPTDGKITVMTEGIEKLEVIDMQGRILMNKFATGERTMLKLDSLPAGVYTIKAISPAGEHTAKVVVKE